ncbi:hypothetical protein ABH922_004277 [Rhodococcus sp. 27YEA15]|uniref:hypothetical protein n=1 Tax=Rhodococcus sp. 27YEA15 TaxID=3156259 RepID=UPI003C7D8E0A
MRTSVRWTFSALFLLLTALGSAVAAVALFVHIQVNDTDAYVATVAPLASDPAVQSAVADRLTEAVTERLDLDHLITDALGTVANLPGVSDRITGLAPVLTRQTEGYVREVALAVVSDDRFASVWTAINREAHSRFADSVTGRATDGIVRVDDTGSVTVSLGPVMTELRSLLRDRGFTPADRLPALDPQFEILQSDELAKAQDLSNALDRVATWLPLVTVVFAVAALLLAPNRLRAVSLLGLVTALTSIAALTALAVVRRVHLQNLDIPTPEAAAAVFGTLTAPLVASIRVLLACGVGVAVIGYLAGGSRSATRMRNAVTQRIGRGSDDDSSTQREVPAPPR